MFKAALISLVALFALTAIAEETKPEVKGFIDVQRRFNRDTLQIKNGTFIRENGSTFLLNQGALYLSKKVDAFKGFIDLPFRQSATAANTTNTFDFATVQAQAFVEYSHESGFSAKAGQWDTVCGIEANDSPEFFFTKQGLTYDLLPVTHSGLLLNYGTSGFVVQGIVGNGNQAGAHHDSTKPEYGFRVGFKNDIVRANVGYLQNKDDRSYTAGGVSRSYRNKTLIDGFLGGTFGDFNVDALVVMIQPNQDKVDDASGSAVDRKNVTGLLGQVTYKVMDPFEIGLRYEQTQNDDTNVFNVAAAGNGTNGNDSKLTRATLGVKYTYSKDLLFKVDVNQNTVKVSDTGDAKSVNYTDGGVAAVFVF